MMFVPFTMRWVMLMIVAFPSETSCRMLAQTRVTWPTPASRVNLDNKSILVEAGATFDGGMKEYYGVGNGEQANEFQPAAFVLKDGATLKNVIIGAPAGDGVCCKGSCTLRNVWWPDVGEDAATFLGTASTTNCLVEGGGARGAADKVFQFNGAGTVTVQNFWVEDFGRFFRTCGDCKTQFQRNVHLKNIIATPGPNTSYLGGVNVNYGDVMDFKNITMKSDSGHRCHICARFNGTTGNGKAIWLQPGADGVNCIYSNTDIKYN